MIGAGSSALGIGGIVTSGGSSAFIWLREQKVVKFHDPPGPMPRPLLTRIRLPITGLGPGKWRSAFFTAAPQVFRHMPLWFRRKLVQGHIRPAPAWFVKDQVIGKVPFHLGMRISQAEVRDGRVRLAT